MSDNALLIFNVESNSRVKANRGDPDLSCAGAWVLDLPAKRSRPHPRPCQNSNKEAIVLGFYWFHRPWLLVRRLGILLARAEHNHPHDDVRRTACACGWVILSGTVVPRGSMSDNAHACFNNGWELLSWFSSKASPHS